MHIRDESNSELHQLVPPARVEGGRILYL
jgi:hypothetical protein